MLKPCPLETKRDTTWIYDQYYIGETDQEKRRSGEGENHWTGAESIEWYNGHFTRDTMNGPGEYRWRYRGADGAFITYEGRFYANCMHGYGTMSYPDGRVFNGLFYKNIRWGPGIDSHACLLADLGFWRGNQLIRLAWRPPAPSVVPDFMGNSTGRDIAQSFRVILTKTSKIIGETNTALELLKQNGAEPQVASQIWTKLYSRHCTDLESQACHVDVFERECYGSKLHFLEEVTGFPDQFETKNEEIIESDSLESNMYFAWNNSEMMLHAMKHCYKHEKQRKTTRVNLSKILNGPRKHFRPAGKHERDSRTLLMASFLGHIVTAAQLINEHNVYPDLSDIQGNTALMYATCGDQADIIHLLVEAGANVNIYNDCCCTPLGVALMRYTCAEKDIAPKTMVEALLPRSLPAPQIQALEWDISRDLPPATSTVTQENNRVSAVTKSGSRLLRPMGSRRGTITSIGLKQVKEPEYDSDDSFFEEKRLYSSIRSEYSSRVNNLFMGPNVPVSYIFAVTDMVQAIQNTEVASPKKLEKSGKDVKAEKKPLKNNNIKPSKQVLSKGNDKEEFGIPENSKEKLKVQMLSKMMLTILQLLVDGADPRLVVFPQPALLIAITAGNADLVRHLVRYGVDVNEKYPGALNYTPLDVAISSPLTSGTLEIIRALLESGAETNNRLQCTEGPGPTLLHALLARKTEYEFEDEILHQVLELLLEYRCNPGTQFRGRSAIDIVMTDKKDCIETFIKSPVTHLNEIINSYNQTILVKMFSLSYFKVSTEINRSVILSHLLLYGADPLIECQDEEDKYRNIFEFTKKIIDNIEMGVTLKSDKPAANSKQNLKSNAKSEAKVKGEKSKSDKLTADEISEYKLEIVLVTECARIIHTRWLQTKLMKNMLKVIIKYKHRQWNMIVKEHEDRRTVGLWLTPQRCIEIWDILKTTKKKLYKDERVLKHLLCVVEFYNSKSKLPISAYEISPIMTADQKRSIESKVASLIKEHRISSGLTDEAWRDIYVKPELSYKSDSKFNICFECALPLPKNDNDKVICTLCFVVSFCSFTCMEKNTARISCHPCSEYLKQKYMNLTEPSQQDIVYL